MKYCDTIYIVEGPLVARSIAKITHIIQTGAREIFTKKSTGMVRIAKSSMSGCTT